MKKYILFFSFFILLVSIFSILIHQDMFTVSPAASFEKAFDATGAEVVSSEVYIRGAYNDDADFEDEEKRRSLINDIINSAGGESGKVKPVITSVDNDILFGTEATCIIDADKSISISILKTVVPKTEADTQILISLRSTAAHPEIGASYNGLIDVLKKNNIFYDVNLRITGSIDGKLSDEELDHICQKVFDKVGANKIEGIQDNGLVSISAFSPSISNSVKVNGKNVNLNVAARYNSYEGKTYIWLANPVIKTEY